MRFSLPLVNARPVVCLAPLTLLAALLLTAPAAAQSGADEYGYGRKEAPQAVLATVDGLSLETKLRRPMGLALSDDGRWLVVANRDSGSISVLDTQSRRIVAEQKVGKRLSHLAKLPDNAGYLVTDEEAHELLWLDVAADGPTANVAVKQRIKVSAYPVNVLVSPTGDSCTVTSLWSQRVTVVHLSETDEVNAEMRVERVIDLPFAPRHQLVLPEQQRLIVAGNFGATLGVVDPAEGKMLFQRDFPGHNIRGLALSRDGQKVLISHQMLNDLANSIRNDIHWGLLMSNDLRWLRIDSILKTTGELYAGAHMFPLGGAGHGTADPGEVAVTADGSAVVVLSGVNEIAVGSEDDYTLERIAVGRRPVALELAADGKTAYVANQFDDSISIVDVKAYKSLATLALGPQPELSLVQRGELLFHDGSLSHDGWMSCFSCHTDGHANSQLNDNLSDRTFGTSKRVLSLLGQSDTAPYAWNGSITNLSTQVRNSIEKTMQTADEARDDEVEAIAAYINTLPLPPSVNELRGTLDRQAIERGKLVFEKRDCANCHAPPTYTTPTAYDVGIHDKQGNRTFNPPSLRGVSHRTPLFHDGSAASLEEVLQKQHHPNGAKYTSDEVRDLVEFLRSL